MPTSAFPAAGREMPSLIFAGKFMTRFRFIKLKLPTALPHFFSAVKMSVPLSVIGAAIAEWLGAQKGLGYFSKRMMTQLDGAGVFAPSSSISRFVPFSPSNTVMAIGKNVMSIVTSTLLQIP